MRRLLLILLFAGVSFTGAQAGIYRDVTGNDLGGIIAWSPDNQRDARALAGEHCAWYDKVARITSVNPRYGQFIGFSCRFPPARAARYRHTVRARY